MADFEVFARTRPTQGLKGYWLTVNRAGALRLSKDLCAALGESGFVHLLIDRESGEAGLRVASRPDLNAHIVPSHGVISHRAFVEAVGLQRSTRYPMWLNENLVFVIDVNGGTPVTSNRAARKSGGVA